MPSFVGALQKFNYEIGPWFLKNRNIARFLEAVAVTLDTAETSLEQGLLLSMPLKCNSSALPVLSIDRAMRLYPSEPDASKRFRLSKWHHLHRARGTHQGELIHAQPYFGADIPIMRIVHQAGDGSSATWHTLAAGGTYSVHRQTPSNWNYDGQTSKWSRFWWITYLPASLDSLIHYDDGTLYDTTGFYDGLALTQIATDLVAMALEWKSAHSRLQAYILATDPASFDPTATAATSPVDGSTTLPVGNWGTPVSSSGSHTRLESAMWIYDAGP